MTEAVTEEETYTEANCVTETTAGATMEKETDAECAMGQTWVQ